MEALALRLRDLEADSPAAASDAQGVPRVWPPRTGLQSPVPGRVTDEPHIGVPYTTYETGAPGVALRTASRVGSRVKGGELTVITGVGHHSVGGPTLPSAVQGYLLENR